MTAAPDTPKEPAPEELVRMARQLLVLAKLVADDPAYKAAMPGLVWIIPEAERILGKYQ